MGAIAAHARQQDADSVALPAFRDAFEEHVHRRTVGIVARFGPVAEFSAGLENQVIGARRDQHRAALRSVAFAGRPDGQAAMLAEPAREAGHELLVEMLDQDDRRREIGGQPAEQGRHGGRAAGRGADGNEPLRGGDRRWRPARAWIDRRQAAR